MPANVVRIENARRHNTNAEKNARKAAESSLARETVKLSAPAWLKKNKPAHAYWQKTVRRMKGISLLDDLDSETLAIYCEQLAARDAIKAEQAEKVQILANMREKMDGTVASDAEIKYISALMGGIPRDTQALQSQERLILQYAQKLGLTPDGRARLARRKAEERPTMAAEDDVFGDGEV